MNRILFTLALAVLISSCAAPTPTATTTPTLALNEGEGFASTSTSTITPSPIEPPTPTEAPELTAEAQPETADLHPAYTESVHMEFMGAQIDASLITDGSLDPTIKKVTVGEQAYAEFVTRSIHGVYQKYHPDVTYETYMKMVGEVQRGERDPLDIAIPLFANDARDGIPYQNPDKSVNPAAQKKYLIIPWYKGDAPKEVDGVEVRSISEINIVLVNGKKVKNLTLFKENGYGQGKGLSLDGNIMYFYDAIQYIPTTSGKKESLASELSGFKWWMSYYHGGTIRGYLPESTEDKRLMKLLLNGGLTINF